MAELTRPDMDIQPFGVDAENTGNIPERMVFGGEAISDELAENLNEHYKRGWGVVGSNDSPPMEWFNGAMYTQSALTAYLYQSGIAQWSKKQTYKQNALTMYNDSFWMSTAGENVGNTPDTSSDKWVLIPTEIATTEEAQTGENDTKIMTPKKVHNTIENSEVISSMQTKLDTHIGQSEVHNATSVATAGRLIIRDSAGKAQIASPSENADIANKQYVDNLITGVNASVATISGMATSARSTAENALEAAQNAISPYDSNRTYSLNDFVTYEGGLYFSLQDDNAGNTPAQATAYWQQIQNITEFDASSIISGVLPITKGGTGASSKVGSSNSVSSALFGSLVSSPDYVLTRSSEHTELGVVSVATFKEKLNVPTMPTVTAGIGQVVDVYSEMPYTLPSGGTWLVVAMRMYGTYGSASTGGATVVKILSGGAQITSSSTGSATHISGFAWRIA